jgi:signal peptidase I
VIFHPPDNSSVNYIKRIVGLPGDRVEIKDGSIYINSQKIDEPYLTSNEQTKTVAKDLDIKLKEDEYFVLGDNRNHSRDSREIGPVPKQNIVSKIWVRLLPLNSVNAFAAVNYENLSE